MSDEFLGMEESKMKKKDDKIILAFPNLKSLIFGNLIVWEDCSKERQERTGPRFSTFVTS